MSQERFWLIAIVILSITVAVRLRRRWIVLRQNYRRLEEYADTLLQHGQGTILNLQGIVNELRANDPVRQRAEQALSRAERELGEFRESMQPHCSEQQHERIR